MTNPTTFTSVSNIVPLPSTLAGLSGPYPTNTWWGNLYLGTAPINCQPYGVAPTTIGLNCFLPTKTTTAKTSGVITNIAMSTATQLALNAVETLNATVITAYDSVSVTVKWPTATPANYLQACFRQGAGFVTLQYNNLTPSITHTGTLTTINGIAPGSNATGTKFKLVLSNGQTWLLYASSSLTISTSSSGALVATAPFTGIIQAAVMPVAADEALLDTYKGIYVTGGSVALSTVANVGTITFNYTTAGTGTLLTHVLPHHMDVIVSPTLSTISSISILKGYTTGITGASWTIRETLPTFGFKPPKAIDSTRTAAITTALTADVGATYSSTTALADPYYGGKYMAKWARLAQIADELGQTTLASTARGKFKTSLIAWLDGTNTNKLLYDTTWGGVISTNGSSSTGGDFGNGIYNDHHFHYGYFLYAAAILAKGDSAFLTAYKTKVNQLAKDIANPYAADPQAPVFRHKDWYHGHSWAHGLSSANSSKDQESVSESVNAYYGLALWGLASGNSYQAATGQLLLATEIHSARRYYHVKADSTVYPANFTSNGTSGIIFDFKIDYNTFFGTNEEYIHAIQMIPNTPIAQLILESDWITQEYPAVAGRIAARSTPTAITKTAGGSGYTAGNNYATSGGSGTGLLVNVAVTGGAVTSISPVLNSAYTYTGSGYVHGDTITVTGGGGTGATGTLTINETDAWKSLMTTAQAVIDPSGAWTTANALTGFDDGMTLTNLLHWVATR